MSIEKFISDIGFEIKNYSLIEKALVHSSYSSEHKLGKLENNERLEFLGDAVLKLSCSDYLYKKYPDKNEGQLSKIRSIMVSDAVLFEFAQEIHLAEYLLLAQSEEKTGGRERHSIIACAFEALLGALYIETSYEKVSDFLVPFFEMKADYIENNFIKINPKAALQEYTQSLNKDLPKYILVREFGKEHEKIFEVEVEYRGETISIGQGATKKEAEQNSAYNALIKLGVVNE